MIRSAEQTAFLNLSLMNFKYIPKEVLTMRNLKRLRLDNNKFLNLRFGIPIELKLLTLLSLKDCRLTYLPESIGELTCLEKLYLDDNLISFLPDAISSLISLIVLGKYLLDYTTVCTNVCAVGVLCVCVILCLLCVCYM